MGGFKAAMLFGGLLLASACVDVNPSTGPPRGAWAQLAFADALGPPLLRRGGNVLDLAADLVSTFPADLVAEESSTSRFVVQFRGPVERAWRKALDEAATVHDYLPDYAFLVTVSPEGRERLRHELAVWAVEPYHPALKMDGALPRSGPVEATVLGFLDVPLLELLADLERSGATPTAFVTTPLEHVVDVVLDAQHADDVARLESVAWIERARNQAFLDNEVASSVTQSGLPDAWSLHARGLDGSSQLLNVCDTGVNTRAIGVAGTTPTLVRMEHEAFTGGEAAGLIEYNRHLSPAPLPLPPHPKIALYYSPQENGNRGDADDGNGHGTQTAGTLAADVAPLAARTDHDGVAYAARIAVCDAGVGVGFEVLNDYDNYWLPAYAEGARVSSNSWGTEATANYTVPARQLDAFIWSHRDFFMARSMGNHGPAQPPRAEAVAKNVVAVGAALNDGVSDTMSPTSSEGPAADGRIKPNVVAPGRCLETPTIPGPADYFCHSGTSASTPVVAGAAALIRDYFAKGHYPTGEANAMDSLEPSAALVRALLELSSVEIAGDREAAAYPNHVQGWGRPLLEDALFFAGDARRLAVFDEGPALETGGFVAERLAVASGEPLRVMAAWTDAPAAAGADRTLVNDLDLLVVGPDGRVYRGNAFLGSEVLPDQGVGDRTNVEEAVFIHQPVAGDYWLVVAGINVPAGPQPFALAATGAFS